MAVRSKFLWAQVVAVANVFALSYSQQPGETTIVKRLTAANLGPTPVVVGWSFIATTSGLWRTATVQGFEGLSLDEWALCGPFGNVYTRFTGGPGPVVVSGHGAELEGVAD